MGLKHLLLSVIGIAVTAALVATVVQERKSAAPDVLIPTLNLSVAPKRGSTLLGAISGGIPVNDYSSAESQNGVILKKDEHNLVVCPQGSMNNLPVSALSGNFQIPSGTRYWGYQYSGRENANYSAGKTKLELFDGTFYLSQGQINDQSNTIDQQNLYNQINKLTRLDSTGSGKQLYFMSEVDLCFICGQSLQTAVACPGHGAASSSASSLSSSAGTGSSSISSFSSSSSSTSSSISSSSSSSLCGNGTVEAPEQCDDGNTSDSDACFSNCRWVVPPNVLP